jgi:hypothetical protein
VVSNFNENKFNEKLDSTAFRERHAEYEMKLRSLRKKNKKLEENIANCRLNKFIATQKDSVC